MRYQKVTVIRSEALVNSLKVPTWEIPVLQAVNGPGNVQLSDQFDDYPESTHPYPDDVQAEWDRLKAKFGSDLNGSQEIPFVEHAYGNQIRGVRELQTVIEREQEDALEWREQKLAADPLLA